MKRTLTHVLVLGILLSTCTIMQAIETDRAESKGLISDYRYPPSSAMHDGSSASARVIAINPEWGNIDTEFVYPDLERVGISKGTIFTVQFKEKSFKVMMATNYDDVQQGEWVAFITADGFLRIARNLESAVKLLGCKQGDNIIIKLQAID
jgi:S-adenosylmethionine hydrolase